LPHAAGACSEVDTGTTNPAKCGAGITQVPAVVPGRVRLAARGVPIHEIADYLPAIGGARGPELGPIDRPVLDRSGLTGDFDFVLEFVRELPTAPAPNIAGEESGPTFLEALQEQLGLKLKSTTGAVDVLVIDHVEMPTSN
jgi:uncharacterized protein (TIGR03435 family)